MRSCARDDNRRFTMPPHASLHVQPTTVAAGRLAVVVDSPECLSALGVSGSHGRVTHSGAAVTPAGDGCPTLVERPAFGGRIQCPAGWPRTGAPVPHSSGSTAGNLRRGKRGNRTLNSAIHRIAITQIRDDTPGRAYFNKRVDKGDSPAKARRALKRRLCRVVFRGLTDDFPDALNAGDCGPVTWSRTVATITAELEPHDAGCAAS
jgi:hypothetical protein